MGHHNARVYRVLLHPPRLQDCYRHLWDWTQSRTRSTPSVLKLRSSKTTISSVLRLSFVRCLRTGHDTPLPPQVGRSLCTHGPSGEGPYHRSDAELWLSVPVVLWVPSVSDSPPTCLGPVHCSSKGLSLVSVRVDVPPVGAPLLGASSSLTPPSSQVG